MASPKSLFVFLPKLFSLEGLLSKVHKGVFAVSTYNMPIPGSGFWDFDSGKFVYLHKPLLKLAGGILVADTADMPYN